MRDLRRRLFRECAVIASGLLAAGCAVTSHSALERARGTYAAAVSPETVQSAPVELYEAEQALRQAEEVWEREGDEEETEHLAYIADKRVAIAEAVAEQAMAEAEASELGERRTQVLLDAREATLEAREQEIEALKGLKAKKTPRGAVITLGDVLFQFGRTDLKPGAVRELRRLVDFLREYRDRNLAIEGHTDSVGSENFNLILSQRRAYSVRDFLVRAGIAPQRITTRGFGEAYPVASNGNASGRQRNRRVDLVILSRSAPASPAL